MEQKNRLLASVEIINILLKKLEGGDSLESISNISSNVFKRYKFKISQDDLTEIEEFLNFSCKRKVVELKNINILGSVEVGLYTNCEETYLIFLRDSLECEINKQKKKNTNAIIYCQSSKVALSNTSQVALDNISKMAKMMADKQMYKAPHDVMITQIVENTKQFVIHEKWDLNDEKGFSWFLGMICKAATLSHPFIADQYDKLFIESFDKHFNS